MATRRPRGPDGPDDTPPAQYRVVGMSEEDGQLIGEQLRRMAQRRRVNNIRFLDPEQVFEEVERTSRHPLRKFFNWDDPSAARTQRIDYMRRLITTVRIVTLPTPEGPRIREPLFVTARAPVVEPGSPALRRAQILRDDAIQNDPAFASVVSRYVRALLHQLDLLEHIGAYRDLPDDVASFIAEVRESANNAGLS